MKILILILILLIVVLNGCQVQEAKTEKAPAEISLSELQITACNEADKAGTCSTRLEELGIIMKEECCQALGKCC